MAATLPQVTTRAGDHRLVQRSEQDGRARGSAKVAVPTWTADAPARTISAASQAVRTPPTPMIGRPARRRRRRGRPARRRVDRRSDSPPPPAPSAGAAVRWS